MGVTETERLVRGEKEKQGESLGTERDGTEVTTPEVEGQKLGGGQGTEGGTGDHETEDRGMELRVRVTDK